MTSFAVAWMMLPDSARGDGASPDPGPPPVLVTSYRVLAHSPDPVSLAIGESVAFSPDGSAVAYGRVDVQRDPGGKLESSSTVVSICSARDGTLTGRIALPGRKGCSVAYSPDGQTLAVVVTEEVKLYDPRTCHERAILKVSERASFDRLTFSADGRQLAVGSFDTVVVWDLPSRDVAAVINARTGFVRGVAFSPDGKTLATAGEGPSLRRVVGSFGWARLALSGTGGQFARWNLNGTPAGPSFDYPEPAYDVAFAPDGQTLAMAGADGARLCAVGPTGQPRKIAALPVYCLAYSRDGRYLAMGTEETSIIDVSGEVRICDTKDGRDRVILQAPMTRVRSVAFAPDGHAVVAATREGVFLWELPARLREQAAISDGQATGPEPLHPANSRRASTGDRWQRLAHRTDRLILTVLVATTVLAVIVLLVRWWWASVLVHRTREQCRRLLELNRVTTRTIPVVARESFVVWNDWPDQQAEA